MIVLFTNTTARSSICSFTVYSYQNRGRFVPATFATNAKKQVSSWFNCEFMLLIVLVEIYGVKCIHSDVLHSLNSYFNILKAYGVIFNCYNNNQINEDLCLQQNCIFLWCLLSPYYTTFIILCDIIFSLCSSQQEKNSGQCSLYNYGEMNIVIINTYSQYFVHFLGLHLFH